MNIYSLLEISTILVNREISGKEELLNQMIDTLRDRVTETQLDEIRTAVFEREKIMSTGVGKNLAIPHGKVATVEEHLASFALLRNPIDFDSIDGNPVNMAFLLIGPEKKNSAHIKLLSRISRLMNNSSFRASLSDCKTEQDIYDMFELEEKRYFGN